MIAIISNWGADLSIGPNGDLLVASAEADVQARIVRRLLTNPGDYIWHTDYGAGLGTYVGETYSSRFIEGRINNQLQLESLVETSPAPAIHINQSPSDSSTTSITIQYQVAGIAYTSSFALGTGHN